MAIVCQSIDEGAKTDAPDNAGDVDRFAHLAAFGDFRHPGIIAESSRIDSRGFRVRLFAREFGLQSLGVNL
jgi:hypothetical protein